MDEDIYCRLKECLHNMPGGYPDGPDGIEIKILKKLYSPEEARLFLELKTEPEEAAAIHARTGIDALVLSEKLEDMAMRGLIFRERIGDKVLYKTYQFFVGIIDAQINRVDLELANMLEEYFPYIGMTGIPLETKQLRVIPAGTAVDAKTTVATYNRMREMVKDEELIAVAPCLCRQMAATKGRKCGHDHETCLSFGNHARFYLDNKVARQISKEELLKLLDKAEEWGLVVNTSNSQDLSIVCCCCPCCCGLLNNLRLLPQTSLAVNSCYQSVIEPKTCSMCGICLERCPIGAITEQEDHLEVVAEKCIGCGLCVSTCPEGAISFMDRPDAKLPPNDLPELMTRFSKERGLI